MFHRITESSGLGDTSRSIYSSHQPSTTSITLIPKCHIKNNYSYNPSPTERTIPCFKKKKPHKNSAPLPAQEIGICVKQAGSDVHGAWGCHTADCSGTKQRSGNGNPNLWSSLGLMQTTWALTWGWGQLYLMKCKGLSSMLKNTDSGNCFFINPCLNSLSVILVT